jgi:hypothetical protein
LRGSAASQVEYRSVLVGRADAVFFERIVGCNAPGCCSFWDAVP